jgi:hypothetical protein
MACRVPRPKLILTGDRRNRRYKIEINNCPVWLSGSLFGTLCDLILNRSQSDTGLMPASAVMIFRLRKAIEEVADHDPQLIETGADADYRLAIDLNDVGRDSSFDELARTKVIRIDQLEGIRSCCRLIEIRMKSIRN